MANKNVNQVIVNGETIIDLTADTVTAEKLPSGITAHDKTGAQITGKLLSGNATISASVRAGNSAGYVYTSAQLMNDAYLPAKTELGWSLRGSAFGDATAADVVAGKTFTAVDGFKTVGTYEPPATEPTLQAKTVTPSASQQVVTPDSEYDGLSQVTVFGDSNLIAANIKSGVSIFGVTGTLSAVASRNNCEAYTINATNPTVSFKTTGTIHVYGYGYTTSSSGWGGSSTTMLAFCGDGYYQSAIYGSPTKKSCTFGVSNGKLTGLPTLNGGALIAVVGV